MFKKLKAELPVALDACHTMDDDKATVNDWLTAWSDPSHLIKEATINYARHTDQVKADRQAELDHFAVEKYFAAGEDFARVMTDLLPMTPHIEDAFL